MAKKELKAKNVSLWAKILGGIILLVASVLKWLNIMPNATIQEIAIVSYGIMGLFSTVDINIMLEKVFHIEKGGVNE
jgi:hypothetical protein